jgi:hypothetical protein
MADKTLKEQIVSFRIPKAQAEMVEHMLVEQPISGVRSVNQWFRKVGVDFVAGRVVYKNPSDQRVDLEAC